MGNTPSPREPVRFRSTAPRVSVQREAQLVNSRGNSLQVVLTDISSDGFRVKADHALVLEAAMTLKLELEGDFPVQIRWTRGREAGGVFLERAPELR